jgi:hypothetical protein
MLLTHNVSRFNTGWSGSIYANMRIQVSSRSNAKVAFISKTAVRISILQMQVQVQIRNSLPFALEYCNMVDHRVRSVASR